MRFSAFVFAATLACAAVIQPSSSKIRSKALNDLKSTLEKIKADILNMRPSIKAAASLVDAYIPKHAEDTRESVDEAFAQLNEKNIPEGCLQDAQLKLNTIRDAVIPNCSAVHVVEDVGALTYNTANFIALSMVALDDVLEGIGECNPWYKFWHYIPCVISYAWTSYGDLKGIVSGGYSTFNENKELFIDIADQIKCQASPVSTVQLSSTQVINEAYLCAKKSK